MQDDEAVKRRIGRRIREHREALGLNQEELAEQMDVSSRWVSDVERGKGNAPLDQMLLLARALSCDISALMEPDSDEAKAMSRPPLADEQWQQLAAIVEQHRGKGRSKRHLVAPPHDRRKS